VFLFLLSYDFHSMEVLKEWSSIRGLLLMFLLSSTSIVIFLQIAGLESRQTGPTAMSELEKPLAIENWCPLPKLPSEVKDGLRPSRDFETDEFLRRQVERLSAAVDVPTVSYEDNGDVDQDPRWRTFEDFHRVLESLFPLV
jgi:Gly-Xaa carboxypeptidase